jgi:lipopolysaccharide transport system permease protein
VTTAATGTITLWKPWTWLPLVPAAVARDAVAIARDFRRSWRVLWSLSLIETRRKYAGSALGLLWYPLYSALLLGAYCFVYLVVFKVRFKDLGTYEYVLFVFAGMIPYLGLSEAITNSTVSVKQSLAILKNAVFPVEFVPVKFVLAALFGLFSSLSILFLMVLPTAHRGLHFLYLPVATLELLTFSVAVAWLLSAVAVLVPDIAYIVNIVLLVLMFISPIGYSFDMVPEAMRFVVYFNPMLYLVEAFRYAMIGTRSLPFWYDAVFLAASMLGACLTGALFRRLSPIFADYE